MLRGGVLPPTGRPHGSLPRAEARWPIYPDASACPAFAVNCALVWRQVTAAISGSTSGALAGPDNAGYRGLEPPILLPAVLQFSRRKRPGVAHFVNRDMTQGLVAPLLDFGGTPSMCVVVSNREKPMDTTASSFTARNNAKRAAEKMIANGKAPAVDYGIRPRDAAAANSSPSPPRS